MQKLKLKMSVLVIGNQIHMIGEINNKLATLFLNKLEIALSYPSKNIELHISSPGGCVESAQRIVDQIQLSYKTIDVYIHNAKVYGGYDGVASAASLIASYANIKTIDFNATFLIHHASIGKKIIEKEDDVLYWCEKTGLDYDLVDNLLKTETKMDAQLAYSFGFVDSINYDSYIIPCF